MKVFILIFLLLGIGIPSSAWADRVLPQEHIKYPVSVTLEDGQNASGFYLMDEGGSAWFVSAKHLFFWNPAKEEGRTGLKGGRALLSSYPQEEGLETPILIRLDLNVLQSSGHLHAHETRDLTVIQLGGVKMTPRGKSLEFYDGVDRVARAGESAAEGSLVGASEEVIKRYADVAVGNDVFIFGYPTSLGIENYPQIDYERPLLRKGVIAGKNNKKRTIILDCPVFYGNSGGPVIEAEAMGITTTAFHIIGMVSEFIPFDDKWYGLKHPFGMREIENSGYSVVVPMDDILDLISKNQKPDLTQEAEVP